MCIQKTVKNLSFILFLIILPSVYTVYLMKFNSNKPTSLEAISENSYFKTQKGKFLNCVKNAANEYYSETYKFFEKLDSCMTTYFPINYNEFDNFPNGASGERKVFLPMAPEFSNQECRWLTIGIGGLIAGEELFHSKYPNCKIFGVEPYNQTNFYTIGKVSAVKIGIEDSSSQNAADGIETISLPRLLDEFVHSRIIHYLSIDIESYEMIVLQELIGKGKFSKEGITFCQIDVELHNPKQGGQHPDAANINRVQWILDFIAEPSPYLPVFTVAYTPAHKVTFVNVVNPECEKAFKIGSYLNK